METVEIIYFNISAFLLREQDYIFNLKSLSLSLRELFKR
jgi:hypothetical protein